MKHFFSSSNRRDFFRLTLFLAFLPGLAFGQISGLGYSLSPEATYTRWHDNAGIGDGFLYGGRLGIAFGEYVELQGRYHRAFDLDRNFESFDDLTVEQQAALRGLANRAINLTRIGGALRFNLGRGNVIPFLTVGTGLQRLEPDELETTESIYLDAGAGLTFSAADRYTASIFVQNTGYRMNVGSALLSDVERATAQVTTAEFGRNDLINWSLGGSLSFYLGGRRPGTLTELDREVMDRFSGGFSGLSFPVEPFVGRIDFPDEIGFRDTDLAGASIGLDFGRLIGLRAFYWRPLEDGEWNKFEDMAIYGGELNFRLSESNGVIPYLVLGGGLVNAGDEYRGENGLVVDDQPFVTGGGGIQLPISRNLILHGGARALLMSNNDVADLDSPDQLVSGWMYQAGLNLVIGKRPRRPDLVRRSELEDSIIAREEQRQRDLQSLSAEYEARMILLEAALERAESRGDSLAANEIQRQMDAATVVQADIESVATVKPPAPLYAKPAMDGAQRVTRVGDRDYIMVPVPDKGELYVRFGEPGGVSITSGASDANSQKMVTREEIRAMIREAMQDMHHNTQADPADARLRELELRLMEPKPAANQASGLSAAEVELMILRLEDRLRSTAPTAPAQQDTGMTPAQMEQLVSLLEKRIGQQTVTVKPMADETTPVEVRVTVEEKPRSQDSDKPVEVVREVTRVIATDSVKTKPGTPATTTVRVSETSQSGKMDEDGESHDQYMEEDEESYHEMDGDSDEMEIANDDEYSNFFSQFHLSRGSLLLGAAVNSDEISPLGGVRVYFNTDSGNWTFYPEVVAGVGTERYLSVSLNGTRNIHSFATGEFQPYAGLGLGAAGFSSNSDSPDLKGTVNLIVGVGLPFLYGRTFVDFTTRNFLKQNQLLAGYDLSF